MEPVLYFDYGAETDAGCGCPVDFLRLYLLVRVSSVSEKNVFVLIFLEEGFLVFRIFYSREKVTRRLDRFKQAQASESNKHSFHSTKPMAQPSPVKGEIKNCIQDITGSNQISCRNALKTLEQSICPQVISINWLRF
jgi:hypothetical protein